MRGTKAEQVFSSDSFLIRIFCYDAVIGMSYMWEREGSGYLIYPNARTCSNMCSGIGIDPIAGSWPLRRLT